MAPGERPLGRQQQAVGKDIVPDAKAATLKAGDDRPLPRIIAAQLYPGPVPVQGRAPSSRGPVRSAWAAIFALLAFFSAAAGDRPRLISREEET